MKISYSGYNKYTTCPRMFKLHYRDKLRETAVGSALIFGSLIDNKLNALLEGKEEEPFEFPPQEIIWDKVDYDPFLLSKEEKSGLLNYASRLGYEGNDIDGLIEELFKMAGRNGIKYLQLSENQRMVINKACIMSINKKIPLIIDKYKKEVLPLLNNIEMVQYEVNMGDKAMGYLDFVAEYEGKRVLFDNKTSKRPYMYNSVKESNQLAFYSYITDIEYQGYIVILKEFKRGEPQIQIIVDKIDDKLKSLISFAIDDVHSAVENGHFPANLNSCQKYFGKPCPYKKYCHQGKMDGLYKKENK